MNRNRLLTTFVVCGAALVLGLFGDKALAVDNIDPNDTNAQFAWGENTGWLNAEPGGDGGPGVFVEDDGLSGYLWAENTGWVSLSCLNQSTCGTRDYRVSNDGAGNLAGYAWSENVGWISFSCTNDADNCATKNYGVTIDPNTGEFSGRAWSENTGWISFRNTTGSITYGVTTSWDPGPLVPKARMVCELKVKEVKGTSQRVANSMHFETFSTDPKLSVIWNTLFGVEPSTSSGAILTLQADRVVTWEAGTLKMGGVMKLSVKTDKKNPSLKEVKIKKAGKKDGTTTFESGTGGVNPNLADGGWHEVKIKNMANVKVTFGSDTVTGFLKELKVKLDKDPMTGAPVVKDFKIDLRADTTIADVKKGMVALVEVEVPATTVTALGLTEYEEKIKDKPEVLEGHTEAEFKREKDALTEGVDISSLVGDNAQLKERKGSCTVGP